MPSGHSTVSIPAVRRAAYSVVNLNSGIFCRSSLFAFNTAWSGYHGLGLVLLAGALLEAEPVGIRYPPNRDQRDIRLDGFRRAPGRRFDARLQCFARCIDGRDLGGEFERRALLLQNAPV